MKRLKDYLMLLLMAAISLTATTSCGGDDDEPTPPPFADEAVKYIAATNSKDIKSIELTAAGDYIIVIDDSNTLKPGIPSPDDNELSIKVGSYSVDADGTVRLQGYGTMVIDGSKLTLTTNAGETVVINAVKASQFAATELNKQLCRTWATDRIGFGIDKGNATIFDSIEPVGNLETLVRSFLTMLGITTGNGVTENEIAAYIKNTREDLPQSVILTRAGTMLMRDANGSYDLKAWRWRDERNRIIEVCEHPETSASIYDERMIVNVNNSELTLRTMKVENPGGTPQIVTSVVWGFSAR